MDTFDVIMVLEGLINYIFMVSRLIPEGSYFQWRYNVLRLSDLVFVGLGRLLVLLSKMDTALCRMGYNLVRRCPLLRSCWMAVFSSPTLKDFPCDRFFKQICGWVDNGGM